MLALGWGDVVHRTYWLGVPCQKNPLDAWVMQEIIWERRPDFIIECGSAKGGSALFMATVCDVMEHGEIISLETRIQYQDFVHERIRFYEESSIDPGVAKRVAEITKGKKVMVVLDSEHNKEQVAKELELWAPLVSKGQYLIVEDTNFDMEGNGPIFAVRDFIKVNNDFRVDKEREKYIQTYNPDGFLERI